MKLFDTERIIYETVARLKEEGVPDEINAQMAAIALGRARMPSYAEIARQLMPIQEMPPGALPIYFEDPKEDE